MYQILEYKHMSLYTCIYIDIDIYIHIDIYIDIDIIFHGRFLP